MSSIPVRIRTASALAILLVVSACMPVFQAHPGAWLLGSTEQATTAPARQPAPAHQPAPTVHATPKATNAPRAIGLDDILAWKNIGPSTISSDGKFLAYRWSPVQGDSEVVVRALDGEKEWRFGIGELPPPPDMAGGGPPPQRQADLVFSRDGKWLAFTVYPARKEGERLRRSRRPLQNALKLIDLSTGTDTEYPKVRQFAFSGESSAALGLLRYAPEAAGSGGDRPAAGAPGAPGAATDRPKGADFILRDLKSAQDLTIGGVSEFAFDKKGTYLAWIADVDGKIGNGVNLRNLGTGMVRTLDSSKATYEKVNWNEQGDALAVVKGVEDKRYEDKLYSVIGFRDLDAPTVVRAAYEPAKDETFPKDMTISPNRAPEWTSDRSALLFGIHEPKKKVSRANAADTPEKPGEPARPAEGERRADAPAPPSDRESDTEEKPDLVIWHWKDPRLQSQQQVQEERDKRFSYLATYRIDDHRFIRLADEDVRDVNPPREGLWAVGIDRSEYELTGSLEGRSYQDVYAVDLVTGGRKPVAKQVRWAYSQSPDGRRYLYYDDAHYYVADLASATTSNITKAAPVSFVNVENDQNVVNPPVPPIGWSRDGEFVLLSDGWDVWKLSADGSTAPVALTTDGRKDQVRYRRRFVLDPDEKGIDLAEPQYFDVYGEWTKKGGVARIDAAHPGAQRLVFDDVVVARVLKAEDADRVAFQRESWKEFPDFHVADTSFANARRVTEGQKQVGAFTWAAGARLVDYTSDHSKKLQAALYLPAGYERGRSYPTIVYIYEKLSDQLNRFAPPSANGFNRSVYTSNGYAVLMPDIAYTINDPGMSAVACVLPALKAAIATGVVDATRVGLHGHSWGGYQTAFLVTQTNAFRAAVAGAPLTDMISMYSLVYKNTGGGNMAIFESSQGRFKGGYWDNWEAYVRNSPIAFAKNVTTPLVILHNDKDGAVDFTQGIEYYNTLRRLKKPVVLLEYVGENHGLRKPVNQQDYTVRMKEFFDHHLTGAPAPKWWTEGVPRLDMDEHLRDRKAPAKPAPKPTPTAG